MKYIENLDMLKNNPKYKNMIEQMKIEVHEFSDTFKDDPALNSEWGHYYFCDDDGGRLVYNKNTPHTHVCEICNKEFTNEVFDGVWIYMYRNEAILAIWKAATLYKVTNDKYYLDVVTRLTDFYVDNYTKFAIHNKEREVFDTVEDAKWGCGRILPQGLNESIILVRLVNALEIVKDDLTEEYKKKIHDNLFLEAFKLLKPQVNMIHNIRCWMNSAIGIMGFYSNDQEMIDFAFKGEYNIRRQIAEGVTCDYFWYEGSIHYNFFALEGITNLALFTKLYGYNGFDTELGIMEDMFKAAYHYAFDNQVFPNPNDGWPSINLKTYSYIYHIANKVFGKESDVCNILKNIECNRSERGTLPLSKPYYFNNTISLEELVFNQSTDFSKCAIVSREARNFQNSHYGIIRNDLINIFMKYGHNGPSHAHPDKMNIEVMIGEQVLSRDLSNAGYRARLCNEWHRVTASHNTVAVDGQNQTSFDGGLTVSYDKHKIDALSNNVYEGVDYERIVELKDDGYNDCFIVKSEEEHTYDFFFHLEEHVEALSNVQTVDSDLLFKENGYCHISNVKKVVTKEQTIVLEYKLAQFVLTCKIKLDDDKVLFLANTLDNPVNKTRKTMIVRFKGKNTKFKLDWQIKRSDQI